MNKQELIDDLIDLLDGKLRNHTQVYISGEQIYKYHSETSAQAVFVCTKDEFTRRARELGWINGYKYGVEYETNGKKPDLPDDVVVDIRIDNITHKNNWRSECALRIPPDKISKIEFGDDVTAFRIVDERYKPVNAEPEKTWQPKVGELANHISWGMPIIIKFLGERLFVAEKTDASTGADKEVCGFIHQLTKPKTEREKFVEAAAKTFRAGCMSDYSGQPFLDGLAALYDAGFKAPE